MQVGRLRRPALAAACLLMLPPFAPASSAQIPALEPPPGIGERIVEVRLEQEGRTLTDPALASLVETRVGGPLAMQAVRETIAHLMSVNRFEDVQPVAEPVPGGVRVRYVLFPMHPVDLVDFRGELGLPESDLRAVVRDRFGRFPVAARLNEIADAVREFYRRHGFPAAQVAARVEATHDPDRATIVIDAASGRRAPIADVQIVQLDQGEQGALPLRPDVRVGRPYDSDEVDLELQEWVERMHALGYYEARATHGGALFPDGDAYVRLNLVRGPHVDIEFSGDPLPLAERERLVPVRAEGSADEDLLEDSSRAIEEYLFARGYRDAKAPYTPVATNGQLTITFDIDHGPRYLVRRIRVTGAAALSAVEIEGLLRLDEGQPFVQATLQAGAAAIENAYRTRGFIAAKVEPTTVVVPPTSPRDPDRDVEVTVGVVEGPRVVVQAVAFQGNIGVAEASLLDVMTTAPGRVYTAGGVETDRDRIDLEYRNRGYDSVVVDAAAMLVESDTRAVVTFTISEGPQVLVDDVIIVGNARTSSQTIARELLLRPGEPLGYTALIDSRARVMALGLFRSVQIEAPPQAGTTRRDVVVRVEEADPTSVGGGGGIEGGFILRTGEDGQAEERFELAPRGFFEIGRRNLWGKNREATLFTRVSLRSRDRVVDPGSVQTPVGSSSGFHEYRVLGTFREPRIFNTAADVLVTGIAEQAIRTSFNFSRRVVRAETDLGLTRGYTVVGRYSFEHTKLFDEVNISPEERPLIDRLFPEVRLSMIGGSLIRDTRDDILEASRGRLLIVTGDLAARSIGSAVGFLRANVEGSTFHRLAAVRPTVLALRARVGAAHGFPRDTPTGAIVQDLPASERFFAGGETTVRGFSLDRLGNEDTISASGFPTGGNGLILLNAELRLGLFGPFQAVGFLDAGNVFTKVSALDFTDLRPAAGFGMRYLSRFGPLRVDLGFNLDRRELVPGTLERSPVLHISLGQAF